MSARKLHGDFQTPPELAREVVALVDQLGERPCRVVEPTVGEGALLVAARQVWGGAPRCRLEGLEWQPERLEVARQQLEGSGAVLRQADCFETDWARVLGGTAHGGRGDRLLVLGNPPWVTNAEVGRLGGRQGPRKANARVKLPGLAAKTGAANFDVAECLLQRLLDALPPTGALAMLCKSSTARRVLMQRWREGQSHPGARLFRINARRSFGVSVEACLFWVPPRDSAVAAFEATWQDGLDLAGPARRFGWVEGKLVGDLEGYEGVRDLEARAEETSRWRSGVKHDAARVMEFESLGDGRGRNGFGEVVALESACRFPLLKAGDLAKGQSKPRRELLLTQRHPGEDTRRLAQEAPRTWAYLHEHREPLEARRSSIYRRQPPFSLFGIGDYSFTDWKVAVSALHKTPHFVAVGPSEGKPVLLDDTAYLLPCDDRVTAERRAELLNGSAAQAFLTSQIFPGCKRALTLGLLQRLSLSALERRHCTRQSLSSSPT